MKAGLRIARDHSVIDVVIDWRDRIALRLSPTVTLATQKRDLIEVSSLSGAREGISCTAQLEGIVEHGDARGCELGYPTANISVQDKECIVGCPS
ncbi:Riboflavin kinase [Arthrobacter sp. OV608]|jgi:FAD synthase|nr:riboflavin kinase [Arthrobacter sp. OV608]SER31948.1 Riboflavin kinase [Arthrobacter sp. OV608]